MVAFAVLRNTFPRTLYEPLASGIRRVLSGRTLLLLAFVWSEVLTTMVQDWLLPPPNPNWVQPVVLDRWVVPDLFQSLLLSLAPPMFTTRSPGMPVTADTLGLVPEN